MKLISGIIGRIRAGAAIKTVLGSCCGRTASFAAFAGLALGGVLCPPMRCLPAQDGVPEAKAIITAHDESGKAVELTADDLQIMEDGRRATVREVRSLRGTPIHYCLVFDSSGSERAAFQWQKNEAVKLLQTTVRARVDRGRFVPFNYESWPGAETDNPEEISGAIAQEQALGATALYDAMAECSTRMSETAPDPGLRAMFVFSDGMDNASRLNIEETVRELVNADIRVYAVGGRPNQSEDKKEFKRGAKNLTELAGKTGGRVYFPADEKEVDAMAASVADELHNSFLVVYGPTGEKGHAGPHQLKIRCTKKDISITAPEKSTGGYM